MRLAVLGSPDSWYYRDLQRAAARGCTLAAVPFTELHCELDGPAPRCPQLDGCDAVLVRTMPPGSLEQVVFRMDCLGQLQAAGLPVVNSPRAMEIAVDKFLCSAALLARAGLEVPRTIVCQTEDAAMQAFAQLGGDVVVKPLFGGEGRGITRINDEPLMLRAAKMLTQLGAVLYLQEFIRHDGYDLRVLVIGSQLLAVRRRNPHDWAHQRQPRAVAEPLALDDATAAIARAAAAAAQTDIAGVDILPAPDGRQLVLEVNAVPGWKGLAAALQTDVARLVLEFVRDRVNG